MDVVMHSDIVYLPIDSVSTLNSVHNIPNSEYNHPRLFLMMCPINRTSSKVTDANPSPTTPAGVRKEVD
jgi:hypothetical protein